MGKKLVMTAIAVAMTVGLATGTVSASEYVTFSGGVLTPSTAGITAGTDAVEQGISTAFGVIAFLGVLALAMGGRYILNFVMSLPAKVFGGTGGAK